MRKINKAYNSGIALIVVAIFLNSTAYAGTALSEKTPHLRAPLICSKYNTETSKKKKFKSKWQLMIFLMVLQVAPLPSLSLYSKTVAPDSAVVPINAWQRPNLQIWSLSEHPLGSEEFFDRMQTFHDRFLIQHKKREFGALMIGLKDGRWLISVDTKVLEGLYGWMWNDLVKHSRGRFVCIHSHPGNEYPSIYDQLSFHIWHHDRLQPPFDIVIGRGMVYVVTSTGEPVSPIVEALKEWWLDRYRPNDEERMKQSVAELVGKRYPLAFTPFIRYIQRDTTLLRDFTEWLGLRVESFDRSTWLEKGKEVLLTARRPASLEPSQDTKTTIRKLRDLLNHWNPTIRKVAAWKLEQLGQEEELPIPREKIPKINMIDKRFLPRQSGSCL